MPRRVITREVYDMLLAAFREKPGNVTEAAAKAGVGWRMAKTGWVKGWPKTFPWAICIADALEMEKLQAQAQAREAEAKRQAEANAARAKAQAAAIEAFEQEARLVQNVRGAALGVLNLALRTIKALIPTFEKLDADIAQANLDVFKRVELMRNASLAVQRAAISSIAALEAQRKHIGAPDHVLRVEGLEGQASEESVMEELRGFLSAAKRAGLATIDVQVAGELPSASTGSNGSRPPSA